MHTSSFNHAKDLSQRYLSPLKERSLAIFDIGSYDVNGSYKQLFEHENWSYTGIDMREGPNVDKVMRNPYRLPIKTHEADIIVSGQAFEHIEYFWISWLDMVRATKPGGMIFLIAPSRGPEHRYPVDCWRFYPDGYRALAKFGNLELLEVSTDWEPSEYEDSAAWGDTVGVFKKPQHRGFVQKFRDIFAYRLVMLVSGWLERKH
ncbi:MAG: class I SAM-dependent methyltransferase [Gammaproteobacteria bacterium]|nr:class I SAM-dependent methyltransferase [Gammaproteobacteria bacterium]